MVLKIWVGGELLSPSARSTKKADKNGNAARGSVGRAWS